VIIIIYYLSKIFIQIGYFLSRVSTLTRDLLI